MAQQLMVFVSYSREDKKIAHGIAEILERGGHKPWIDNQLVPGQRWKDKLQQAISDCDAFLILLSPSTLDSEWCQWEYGEALDQEKPIFPVIVKPIGDGYPELFAELDNIQYLDITNGITASSTAALIGGIFRAEPVTQDKTTDTEKPVEVNSPTQEYDMETAMTLTDKDSVKAIDITEPMTRLPVPHQNPLPPGVKAELTISHARTDSSTFHPIHMTMFTIGRGSDMDLTIPEKRVSKHHLSIYWANSKFFLVDYSLNGTWLNGERIQNNRPVALDAHFEHRIDLARTDTSLNFKYLFKDIDK